MWLTAFALLNRATQQRPLLLANRPAFLFNRDLNLLQSQALKSGQSEVYIAVHRRRNTP
jgi:hypothetical protein